MIVEINGIKMEVDERTAKVQRVDTFKIGDPVKVLQKTYSGHEVKPGIIVAFDQFQKRPTITVAYLEYGDMKFVQLFDGCEHEMVAATAADLDLNKDYIVDRMKRDIEKKQQDVREAEAKLAFFVKSFGHVMETKSDANVASL